MRDGHEQLQGVLSTIKFHQANFLIGVLHDGTTVKGNMLSPQVGLEYAFRGRWERHPRWGEQFAFADYRASYPTDLDAVRSYLMENCKWIGPEISKRLVSTYGKETLAICKEHPDRVALANPVTHVRPDAPPFLVVHGDSDPLVPHHQSELLVAALQEAQVPVQFYTVVGAGHGGFTDPQVPEQTRAFLAQHL